MGNIIKTITNSLGFFLFFDIQCVYGFVANVRQRRGSGYLNLQSRCFFLGPLTSCVVALHTALLIADPVMLC